MVKQLQFNLFRVESLGAEVSVTEKRAEKEVAARS